MFIEDEPVNLIRLLTKRISFLRAVDDGASDTQSLIEALELSESAVYKGVSELKEKGFLRETENGYRLTKFGELTRQSFDQLVAICETQPLLAFHWAESDLPPAVIYDGDLILSSEQEPYRPTEAFESLPENADSIRCLMDVAIRRQLERFRQFADEGVSVKLIVTEDVLDADTTDILNALVDAGVELYTTDRYPWSKLLIADTDERSVVGVGLGDERRIIKGYIEADTERVVSWANDRFERYRQDARRIDSHQDTIGI